VDLNETCIFAQVVKTGSFTAAAKALGIPKSTVSRKVMELEQRLGARLLQRTTRRLSLTDVGRVYHQHALRVLSEVEAAELAVVRMQETPRGLLRVTTPMNSGYLGPIFVRFLEHHPEVQLEVVCTDRIVDLIHDGFDVAIRAGRLVDSSLVARTLGASRSFVVASPSYVERRGAPTLPKELKSFDCLLLGAGSDSTSWTLKRADETVTVPLQGRFVVNDFDVLERATLGGIGIALLPVQRCAAGLARGSLVRLLTDWCSPETPIHAVYPSARLLSPKVKAFVDHTAKEMTPLPWERTATADDLPSQQS
jgi:DNA-binding transcriptional LysR family regulator